MAWRRTDWRKKLTEIWPRCHGVQEIVDDAIIDVMLTSAFKTTIKYSHGVRLLCWNFGLCGFTFFFFKFKFKPMFDFI
jgi:hypothetical protein